MALRDVTNTASTPYIPQIQLAGKYAPLIRRGKTIDSQASRSSFPIRRAAGETNIDLWVDGCLYPVDPATQMPPTFHSTKEYLEFLCNGEQGMLGYTKRLKAGENAQTMERMTLALQSKVTGYEAEIQQLRILCERLESLATCMSSVANEDAIGRQKLCCNIEALEARCGELGAMLMQCEHDHVVESTDHHQKVEALEEELRRCNVEYKTLEKRMRSMVETPRGYRERIHGARMKSFSDLSCGSRYAKRQRALVRGILQPAVVARVRHANKQGGGKKRLSGDFAIQVKTAECVASMLRPSEAAAMVDQPMMS